ncbi:MAG: hypothetical protein ACTSPB_02515 [Candidatus Thorarchaeota archaeon]
MIVSKEEREKEIKSREDYKKSIEEDKRRKAEAASAFDIDEFIADADIVREVYIEEIDRNVQYKKLTVKENAVLMKTKDVEKRGTKMLYLMLSKADSTITEEKIENLGSDVAGVILANILKDQSFLQKMIPSK